MEIKNLVKGKEVQADSHRNHRRKKIHSRRIPGIPGADREGRDICTIPKQI